VSRVATPVQPVFDAVRAACSASLWSRGVELARAGAVSGERDDGDEVVLRVSTRGGLLCPTALLYLDDAEWECDCGTREEACEHVAAAVIALRKARNEGLSLPEGAGDAGRIGYRLTRAAGALQFARVVLGNGDEQPLRSTLAAISSGRVSGPAFVATQDDLAVERVLGATRQGSLPRGVWAALLPALAGCPDVRLDGRPVRASGERVGWVGRLEDQGDGFVLRVLRDPRVVELFDEELALLDDGRLCRIGGARLSGREREQYEGPGRHFAADEAVSLASEILPDLSARLPIEIRSDRLPSTRREPPRIAIELAPSGDELSVLPTLVYGDPPSARVDAGRLVPLGGPLPLRDEAAEQRLTQQLARSLELLPGRRVSLSGESAVELAARIARFDADLRGAETLERFRRTGPLAPELHIASDRFELAFAASDGPGSGAADPERVLQAWRSGESLVPLQDGGFAPLPADWLDRFGDSLADLLAARGRRRALPRAALPQLADLCEALELPVPEEAAALRLRVSQPGAVPAAALPDDLTAQLRDYQRRGVDWLCAWRDAGLGALLADDMGLGKTLQALCALRGRTLVVAPRSVLENWAEEAARFRPGLRCSVYHGPGRRLDPRADLTLTTYALLRLDAEALAEVSWDTLVLDESQAIKNPDSQAARAAFRLRGDFRVALTGTPVENRLAELWSQLHFTNPGLLGDRRAFEERYGRPIAAGDASAGARLRQRIAPFVLRRAKSEVAPELPPRTDLVLHAELSQRERALYDAIRAATREEVLAKLSAGAPIFQVLEALLRLRQAACHPALVPGQQAETSAKLEVLVEALQPLVDEGHKALVFSQWTSLLDQVEPPLTREGIDYARLDGATRNRGQVVADFQSREGPPVLLVSLRAGGTGLNLTAADSVFILDPWWNPAVEDQAADRAHRIGQDRPVFVYRVIARDTVEERILALQQHKRGLADAALGDAARAGGGVTRDELIALLD
jgi:superfamily II DNA or RNA helicase